MGAGSYSKDVYASYSTSLGRSYDADTGRVSGQVFVASGMHRDLNPRLFEVRECVNTEEHPNTIPVILALDVTGSMGKGCTETAESLGIILGNLLDKIKDVEFCIMGIGDLAYDSAPIQMSQFESDIRIAESLDKIYQEFGGGGNAYESYTAAWYMGLYRTKLDCFDKQGRKGIIITMGDEPLNPYLPKEGLNRALGTSMHTDVETKQLFEDASKKFDIFHIAVDHPSTGYRRYKERIENSFGQLLGPRYKVANLDQLSGVIEECILEAGGSNTSEQLGTTTVNENGEIKW